MKKVLLSVLLVLVATPSGARTIDRIAAVVDQQVITTSEVEQRAAMLRQQLGKGAKGDLGKQALESLVDDKLLEKQLKDLSIDISESELKLTLEDLRRQNGFSSIEQLERAVEKQGLSWQEYRETLRRQLAQMKLLNVRVRSRVKISEDEVKRRYAELSAAEKGEREIRASHLLVSVPESAPADRIAAAKARAEGLLAKARQPGQDFAALARTESDGPSRDTGGDLGWFRRGEMVPELEKMAFGMKPGEIAGPVRTRFGWHVLRVDEARDVAPRPLSELSDQIRDRLHAEEIERQTSRYLDELRKAALIEYKVPELAPAERS